MKNRVFKLAGGLALAGVLFVSNFSNATASVGEADLSIIDGGLVLAAEKGDWELVGPNFVWRANADVKFADKLINPAIKSFQLAR